MRRRRLRRSSVLNRDLEKAQELELRWHDLTPTSVTSFETLTGPDLKALNTFADPKKVIPQTSGEAEGGVDDDGAVAGAVVFGDDFGALREKWRGVVVRETLTPAHDDLGIAERGV